jgi:hypothetical protein
MKSKRFISVGAAVCTLGLVAVPISANASGPGSDVVELRTHIASNWWLPGASTIEVDTSADAMPWGWNDGVSSLWVWSDVSTITLWEDENKRGLYETFEFGTDNLADYDFDNMTSSYTIRW